MTTASEDPFPRTRAGIQDVPSKAFAIAPSDTDDLATLVRGIYVGTGGDLAVVFRSDSAPVTFVNIPSGAFIAGRIKRVMNTDTTAADLVGVV